eukprot:TRINITY_DN63370_c0_g1_i2.p2 TRINITY_DN63370_c0_g1~~TRINITY_DN63370_c0_g1_i2.p2  ORF type:complete len:135 (-),score=12.07 TRINITY_DN63370_c0_g1_i2:529-933(-)
MRRQDPYGWFQWYCRFYLGRRTDDDARQIERWVGAIGANGRWRTFLVGACVKAGCNYKDPKGSPVTRQTLLHWAYEITKADWDRLSPAIKSGKSVVYMGVVGGSSSSKVSTASSTAKKRPAASSSAAGSKRSRH